MPPAQLQAGSSTSALPPFRSAAKDALGICVIQDILIGLLEPRDLSALALTCAEGYQAVARQRWRRVVLRQDFFRGDDMIFCHQGRRMSVHLYELPHWFDDRDWWLENCGPSRYKFMELLKEPPVPPAANAPHVRAVRLIDVPLEVVSLERIMRLFPNVQVVSHPDFTWTRAAESGKPHRVDFKISTFNRNDHSEVHAENRKDLRRVLGQTSYELFEHFGGVNKKGADAIEDGTLAELYILLDIDDESLDEMDEGWLAVSESDRDDQMEEYKAWLLDFKRLCDYLGIGGDNDEPQIQHLHITIQSDILFRTTAIHEYIASLKTSARITLVTDTRSTCDIPVHIVPPAGFPSLRSPILGPAMTWRNTLHVKWQEFLRVALILAVHVAAIGPTGKKRASIELQARLGPSTHMHRASVGYALDLTDALLRRLGSELYYWAWDYARTVRTGDMKLELLPFYLEDEQLTGLMPLWHAIKGGVEQVPRYGDGPPYGAARYFPN